jgi:hypothetical protein
MRGPFSQSFSRSNDTPGIALGDVQGGLKKRGKRPHTPSDVTVQSPRDQNSGSVGAMNALEPLLATAASDNTADSHTVSCNGVKGTLTIYLDGGVSFKTLEVCVGRSGSCSGRHDDHSVPQLLTKICPDLNCRSGAWCGAHCVEGRTQSQR